VKKIIYISLIVILTIFFVKKTYSQSPAREIMTNLYFSPFITVGYTFNTGLTYGLNFTFGLIKIKNNKPEINACISLQYYFVNYQKSQHIIKTIDVVAESKYFRIGMGAGEIKKSWGFNNRNVNRAFGTSYDFGITAYSTQVPWIGVKEFLPKKGTWEVCKNKNYISTYTYFRQTPIYLFK